MKTIWKFPFHVSDSVAIEMPKGAVILPHIEAGPTSVAPYLFVWATVDPEQPTETRVLHVVGTGNPMPKRPLAYLGTTVQAPFVWHVYEAKEDER